jgi:hypothetical protein
MGQCEKQDAPSLKIPEIALKFLGIWQVLHSGCNSHLIKVSASMVYEPHTDK